MTDQTSTNAVGWIFSICLALAALALPIAWKIDQAIAVLIVVLCALTAGWTALATRDCLPSLLHPVDDEIGLPRDLALIRRSPPEISMP